MPRKIATIYEPEMLRSVVLRLERLAERLRGVQTWMEEEKCEKLAITNHSSMVLGLENAEAFGQAAERAVDNCRLGEPKSVELNEKA